MQEREILFIQGGGRGAHAEDALLVDALRQTLGAGHTLRFPQMPQEEEPDARIWGRSISEALRQAEPGTVLVGHSIGGALLLKHAVESAIVPPVSGMFLLAAPAWDGQRWAFDDLKLPPDAAARLAAVPALFFYHCRDDEIVPFDHLALHRARCPGATFRPLDAGGHQFDGALATLAADLRNLDAD